MSTETERVEYESLALPHGAFADVLAEVEFSEEAVDHVAGYVDGRVKGQDLFAWVGILDEVQSVRVSAGRMDDTKEITKESHPRLFAAAEEAVAIQLEEDGADAPITRRGALL